MYELEILATSLIGFLLTALSISSQVELWQRKEYRWDRLLAHWREGAWLTSGSELFILLALSTVGISCLAVLAHDMSSAHVGGWLALLFFAGHHGYRGLTRGVYRPYFTPKALAILVSVGVLTAIAGYYVLAADMLSALNWAALITLIPYLTVVVVVTFDGASRYRKQQVIARASKLRVTLSALTVVGITGSFGKTSTKHFLGQILRETRVPCVATKAHRNAVYPVALDMLEQLTPDTKMYIAEMGAYAGGEVAELAKLVKPTIGAITAIGNQHLGLFGGQQALLKAKWELAEALPKDGILVLNKDDKLLREHANQHSSNIIWYSSTQTAEVYFEDIVYNPQSFAATWHVGDQQRQVTVPLAGSGAVSSVAAATALAYALHVSFRDIAAALSTLQAMPRTMEVRSGSAGSTIIDDSYSANEHGVMMALDHLKVFPEKRKIVVLAPLIELGSDASVAHERIGRALAQIEADIFVAGTSYRHELSIAREDIRFIENAKELTRQVKQEINPGVVVLIEGRIPESTRCLVIGN